MISVYGIQETAIIIVRDILDSLKDRIITNLQYILIAIGLILLYFVLTRLFLRGTVYKTARKELVCVLSMSGRERSLEYLERFGEMKGIDAQVIRYLRKHGSVPKKYLEKTFGKNVIQKLIEQGMIEVM